MTGSIRNDDALNSLVAPVIELHAEFVQAARVISGPHSLTPAQWQVLGAIVEQPYPVAEIARTIGLGLARQSVQRVADDLVARGWAYWRNNPKHRKAKLLVPTPRGAAAVSDMRRDYHDWALRVGAAIGADQLAEFQHIVETLVAASQDFRADYSAPTDG
ncbi:MarR family winged helix-turn-helix transcriptional regulator [Corynebacterium sp.]|uniref:MarR family winged helix-turn-helix transcriptional regulator n=1 Tax=Corynebacterium sp. TaxID=1720 RepID=UPI0026DC3057|nr:MarR family winged helix-turn-helix transcriptional regulator [Corynebacterium sp.]MDO5077793.1 MarR family winged helix-turn-helix transcriptional regulator [Corynebacterium sp.]